MLRLQAVIVFLLLFAAAWAQVADTTATADSGIRVSAFVEPRNIPQNRTAQLTIRLEWTGDLDRYEVTRFDNPLVQNLDIISTASANKVSSVDGQLMAQQDYQYTLKPEALGMGYVDGIIIRYNDAATGKEYRLYTNRLEVEIIDPLPEPGRYTYLYMIGAIIIVAIPILYIFIRRHRQKVNQARLEEERLAAIVPLEQQYLNAMKEQINLSEADLQINETFAALSRLLRQYIAVRWQVPGMELTTSELVETLKSKELDDRSLSDIEASLHAADVAKFSGGGDRATLDRVYTLVESLLQRQAGNKAETVM
ncbi:hypothetical protein JXO59_01855 [candidate division KSB1 bacterium]|nr:hypothetical protein [candidate division KSB1 bacterium]